MRPIVHPAIENVQPEMILHALSDPDRAAILVNIMAEGGIKACSTVSALGDRVIPKSSLSNHFKILREAGLIRSERQGKQMRNHLRLDEVNARFPGLLGAIMNAYTSSNSGDETSGVGAG